MNAIAYGVVVSAPDGDGFLQVSVGGTTRRVWAQPERFAAPWYVPEEGDRVALTHGRPNGMLLWVIGRGTATYEFAGS